VATGVSSYTLLNPGEAESASGMNYANFQYRVLRTAPVLLGSGGTVTVETKNAAGAPVETGTRASSLLLKSGNSDYFCKNLAAPACSGLATSSVTTSQTIVANNGATFEGVVFDKFSQCVKSVASCSGQTCRTIPFDEFAAGHGVLKDISTPGQVCTNIIIEDDQTNSTYYCSRSGVCYY
jgi:hypothetical protein